MKNSRLGCACKHMSGSPAGLWDHLAHNPISRLVKEAFEREKRQKRGVNFDIFSDTLLLPLEVVRFHPSHLFNVITFKRVVKIKHSCK